MLECAGSGDMELDERLLYERIGSGIRTRRLGLGLTQGQLAEAAGVLRSSVANVETGKQRSPLHLVYRLCVALDLDVRQILPDTREVTRGGRVEVDTRYAVVEMPSAGAEFLRELRGRGASGVRE